MFIEFKKRMGLLFDKVKELILKNRLKSFFVLFLLAVLFIHLGAVILRHFNGHYVRYSTKEFPKVEGYVREIYSMNGEPFIVTCNTNSDIKPENCGIEYPKNEAVKALAGKTEDGIQLSDDEIVFYLTTKEKVGSREVSSIRFYLYDGREEKIKNDLTIKTPEELPNVKKFVYGKDDLIVVFTDYKKYLVKKLNKEKNIFETIDVFDNEKDYVKKYDANKNIKNADKLMFDLDDAIVTPGNKKMIYKRESDDYDNYIIDYIIDQFEFYEYDGKKTGKLIEVIEYEEFLGDETNFIVLNDHEVVALYGKKFYTIFFLGADILVSRKSYIIDTNTYKIKRTGNMKFNKSKTRTRLNDNTILFYTKGEKLNEEYAQIFKR